MCWYFIFLPSIPIFVHTVSDNCNYTALSISSLLSVVHWSTKVHTHFFFCHLRVSVSIIIGFFQEVSSSWRREIEILISYSKLGKFENTIAVLSIIIFFLVSTGSPAEPETFLYHWTADYLLHPTFWRSGWLSMLLYLFVVKYFNER